MTVDPTALPEPGAFAVSNHRAWIGRKEANLRRHTLDCGCPNRGEVFFHLWCDRLACREHADAPHDCGEFKGESGIEEKPAPVDVIVMNAFHDMPMPSEPSTARASFALADMEAASAAVRARRAQDDDEPDTELWAACNPPLGHTVTIAEVAALGADPSADEIADYVENVLGVPVEPWQRQMLAREPMPWRGRSWWRRMLGGTR